MKPFNIVWVGLMCGCSVAPPDAVPGATNPADVIGLELIADGFASPVALVDPHDDSGRLFVVDQVGLIEIIDSDGARRSAPFLDLTDRVIGLSMSYDERGLLGLAFHPDYAANGRFFVYYTAPKDGDDPSEFDSENRVAEFRVSAQDADRADRVSERVLLDINNPQSNHNAGQLAFGPDGFLYVGVGDGGGANDVGAGHAPDVGNGQDKSTLLGKILRIDVDGGVPYAVPPDNPFVNDSNARSEIWAMGLRNPWRFSFDAGGGRRLFVADVGQNLFEEVDIIVPGGNYGWNLREAAHCFNPVGPGSPPVQCPTVGAGGAPLIDPIIEYAHVDNRGRAVGISVIGGFVYRGGAVATLRGRYVFGDYSAGFFAPDGRLFAADERADGNWTIGELTVGDTPTGRIGRFILAFGEDAAGELYVLTSARTGVAGTTGRVERIVAAR